MGSKVDSLKLAKNAVHPLVEEWRSGNVLSLSQVAEAARPFLAAFLAAELDKPLCIVLREVREQELFYSDFETWLEETAPGQFEPLFFPEEESLRIEGALRGRSARILGGSSARVLAAPELEAERWEILRRLTAPAKTPIVVTTVLGAEQPLADPAKIREQRRTIAIGDDLPPETWLGELAATGYILTAQAAGHGQFAHRGGIVDVFPYNATAPYRVEFFGDRVDSIRVFDPDTQASTRTVDSFEMLGEPGDRLTSTLIDYLPKSSFFIESTEEHFLLRSPRSPAPGPQPQDPSPQTRALELVAVRAGRKQVGFAKNSRTKFGIGLFHDVEKH